MAESDAPGTHLADRRALAGDRQPAPVLGTRLASYREQEAISGAPVPSLWWTKLGSGLGLRLAHRWPPRLLFHGRQVAAAGRRRDAERIAVLELGEWRRGESRRAGNRRCERARSAAPSDSCRFRGADSGAADTAAAANRFTERCYH
jgi:hypothetical protein